MPEPTSETHVSQLPATLPTDTVVLDVREDDEWRAGHIEDALHVSLQQLPERIGDVPDDRQVLVVCRSGGRSARATGFLRQQGKDAVNLAGGMQDWQAAGRPMTSETGAAPDVV